MAIVRLQERRVNPEIIVDAGSADLESKEEIFQDSKAWLGSDSEDDYYSVKENNTPSSVASSLRGSPPRTRICIRNLYYGAILERKKIHMIPPPPSAMAAAPKNQKPLIELLKDPYWSEQIKEGSSQKRQIRLVEFLEESFWREELSLSLTPSSDSRAAGNGKGKGGSKRVQNNDEFNDNNHGCCIPSFGFWFKKRKTKAAVS